MAIFLDCILSFARGFEMGERMFEAVRLFTNPILAPFEALQERLMPGLPIGFAPIFALISIEVIAVIIFPILL